MIPNHFSLVAVNPFQQAVQLAIIDVESSLMAGKRLGRFPWAMALLRRLRAEQAGRITAKDVMCATSGYEPGKRLACAAASGDAHSVIRLPSLTGHHH